MAIDTIEVSLDDGESKNIVSELSLIAGNSYRITVSGNNPVKTAERSLLDSMNRPQTAQLAGHPLFPSTPNNKFVETFTVEDGYAFWVTAIQGKTSIAVSQVG